MPLGFVKTERDEELWSKAKARAVEQGHKEDWAYINGIYQRMKGHKKTASLLHAISSLDITKDVADTNAPIQESEGDMKQAELNRNVSDSCGKAISLLSAIQKESAMNTPLLNSIEKDAVLGGTTFGESLDMTRANRNAALNAGRSTPTSTSRPGLLSRLMDARTRLMARSVSARNR